MSSATKVNTGSLCTEAPITACVLRGITIRPDCVVYYECWSWMVVRESARNCLLTTFDCRNKYMTCCGQMVCGKIFSEYVNFPLLESRLVSLCHWGVWYHWTVSKISHLQSSVEIVSLTQHLAQSGVKGKAIPLQAWRGPEGSRRLRLPDFKTISTWRW